LQRMQHKQLNLNLVFQMYSDFIRQYFFTDIINQ